MHLPDTASAMLAWDSVFVQVTDVRHGLLIKQQRCQTEENSMFLFVKGRKTEVVIGHTPYQIQTNALFHVARNTNVEMDASKGEIEYYLAAYQVELPQNTGRELTRLLVQENPFDQNMAAHPQNEPLLLRCFERMEEAWRGQTPEGRLLSKSLLYTIIHAFYAKAVLEWGELSVDKVEKIRRYLDAHYVEESSIQMLANNVGISRSSLHEQFRKRLGVSPQQYLTNLRLDAACRALGEGRLNIQEIAVSCGLRNRNYFFKLYKQRFGTTPGEYRRQHALSISASEKGKAVRYLKGDQAAEDDQNVLIENFGRIHRYRSAVERVVCLSYCAAEIVAALGAAGRIVGLAGAEEALCDCDAAYQPALSSVTLLPARSEGENVPTYAALSALKPDLVVGTSYSFYARGGVEDASTFERDGIHIYALTATCKLDSTMDDVYTDIINLGEILGCQPRAVELADAMRAREKALIVDRPIPETPPRVFVYDGNVKGCAFTCGRSLESHMIRLAGGINVFGAKPRQYTPVTWGEVARADPEVILVHSFYGDDEGKHKADALRARAELAGVRAIETNRIHVLGIKKIFPGLGNVQTILQLARWFTKGKE